MTDFDDTSYLDDLLNKRISVFLVNGIKLEATLMAHNDFALLLTDRDSGLQLVNRRNVTTIKRWTQVSRGAAIAAHPSKGTGPAVVPRHLNLGDRDDTFDPSSETAGLPIKPR